MGRAALLLLAGLAALPPAAASVTVRDIDGHAWTPLSPAKGQIDVLIFVTVDCPISNRYAPEIGRIAAEYSSQSVRTFLVYADPTLDTSSVRTHVQQFHATVSLPAIVDTGLVLTTAAGATVTPEVAIYAESGRVYRGRIDDLYVNIGQSRREPTRRDLRLTLDALLAGRPVPAAETQAIGCFIDRSGK